MFLFKGMKQKLKILLFLVILASPNFAMAILDASINGTVYGDTDGLSRVASLESQLDSMVVKSEHPRIILTPELIVTAKQRVASNHYKWSNILASADSGNTINSAFVYLITEDVNYATSVYNNIMADTATIWVEDYLLGSATGTDRKVAEWAIAFDWVYNGLTQLQRDELSNKIGSIANIEGRASWIRSGNRINSTSGETFHREEWIFFAWRAWPEIALANHVTDADFCYKSRWNYDSIYGDAARAYAYLNDGTPLEGYQYGADGTSWFATLKSATNINLIDGAEFHYDSSAAEYQLYGMDFGLNRNIFHHGVGAGAGGLWSYTDTQGDETNWKLKEYHSNATQLVAPNNPYQQWFAKNILTFDSRGASSWIFSNEYFGYWSDFENIATLLFYDPSLLSVDPKNATYQNLPFAKHFSGGNEVYMRTSWGNDATVAGLRSTPAFTKSSHGDYDVNTFILYRKGNLAPDSGVYDAYQAQTNYFGYQKNTVAHNNILIIDPANPDEPKKLNASPDPGGTDSISTRTFGNLNAAFPAINGTFLLNSKADWGDIVSFETTEKFDYSVSDASKAYGTRADEYNRSLLFLRRPANKAYVIVYDRVNSTNANFNKKWLLHTVGEPALNGSIVNTEIDGNIYSTDGDTYSATNVYNNSALYGKVLMPQNHVIRKIGGGTQSSIVTHNGNIYIASKNHIADSSTEPGVGANWSKYWARVYMSVGSAWESGQSYTTDYSFWVDGATPRNWSIDWSILGASKEPNMNGPIDEIGKWRLELMPNTQQQRDLFLNVIYVGDAGEDAASASLISTSDQNRIGSFINDLNKNIITIFNKNKFGLMSTDSFSYEIAGTTTASAENVITEVSPNTTFNIEKDGVMLESVMSSAQGNFSFDTAGDGTITITADIDEISPSAPTGLNVL